jgi:hypothetical protein
MAEVFEFDSLFAGKVQPVVAGAETITGGNFARGTVLGYLTATDKCTIVDSEADPADGSENVYAILAEDVDASGGDVVGVVYYTGEFNTAKLTFGGTDDADDHKVAARNIGIFFKDAVPA